MKHPTNFRERCPNCKQKLNILMSQLKFFFIPSLLIYGENAAKKDQIFADLSEKKNIHIAAKNLSMNKMCCLKLYT